MSERVQVHIRFRPHNERELAKGSDYTVELPGDREVDVLPVGNLIGMPRKTFTFDRIFDWNTSQDDVYQGIGVPVVESVLQGYNGTILAYGQTGSGKTHTMMGPEGGRSAALDEHSAHFRERGLIPRIVAEIFQRLEAQPKAEMEWKVSISCFELYKEQIRDLIVHASEHKDLRIREDRGQTGRGIYVENLREVTCQSTPEIFDVIRTGMKNKQVASTGMNDTSSRSHTLIILWVTQVSHIQADTKTVGRLNLVDLAGSERIEKTGAEGDRLKEAQMINLSLTLLGNVIMKLTDGKSLHIPYRDSKLTRILQDSFGGNSRTTLLCNCSPSALHQQETVSTLGFANRAKQIKNKPRVNKEMSVQELQTAYERAQEEIRFLKDRIAVLEELLAEHGGAAPRTGPSRSPARSGAAPGAADAAAPAAAAAAPNAGDPDGQEEDDMRATLRSVLRELGDTKEELFDRIADVSKMSERAAFYEKRHDEAQQKFSEWKAKYERERMAADSWMRKYNELCKEMEQREKQQQRAANRPRSQASRKGSQQLGRRSSSQARGAGAAAAREGRAPTRGGDSSVREMSPVTPVDAESVAGDQASAAAGGGAAGDNVLAEALEEARQAEAQGLMRERELQQRLDDALEAAREAGAAAEAAERRAQESTSAAQRLNAELERTAAEYEEMLQRQDREITELQQELELCAQRGGGAQLHNRLEHENALLYEQNRENAQRLVELTRAKDQLERMMRQTQEKEARLLREIELANISADVKHRLLGSKLRATKAAFQQRLLECFASDQDQRQGQAATAQPAQRRDSLSSAAADQPHGGAWPPQRTLSGADP
eukprot:TRINITY_DN430_c0_g3_i1.p1 TRINITY_DN430_c0_g3~~TRINITY_DN430_c0_g3_i1.p1  ORF type:complete len:859 (+),score=305.22 TRINITY_DN430_c0_g3_i1:87-2579(+)